MWYILEIEGTVQGSTRMGSAQILAIGLNLQHAQNGAVNGFLDGAEGMQLDIDRDAVDFAYVVRYARSCDRTVIAVQMQKDGTLRPHNT